MILLLLLSLASAAVSPFDDSVLYQLRFAPPLPQHPATDAVRDRGPPVRVFSRDFTPFVPNSRRH